MPSTTGYIGGVGQVRLTLEPTLQPTENGGDILATAILTTERNPVPIEGHTIVFYLGANEVTAEQTNAEGRVSHTFAGLNFGTHAVSIQTAGVHVTHRHTFTKPIEKVRVPASLSVTFVGPRGQQKLLIYLNTEDGSPVSGFSGTIRDGDKSKTFKTDATGAAIYHTRFTGASRAFEVRASNKPGLVWRGRLLGPKPTITTPTP